MRCQKRTRLSNILISYYLDGDRVLGEDWGDGDTAYTQWRYFYDLNGIAGLTYNNVAYSLVSDVLGNVSFILKGKNVIGKYSYDAYGNCIVTETANISEDERFVVNNNPWRWKGYYYDTESNLYYIRGRYYDPRIMQYIDADTPENIFSALMGVLNGLDRNAVVCNNIVAFVINSANIQTYLELYANITQIDKEESSWWKWVVGALIILILAIVTAITLGGALLAVLGGASALAVKLATIGFITAKILLGSVITAVVGMVAGGIQYSNGSAYWDWDGAAEGFMYGAIFGAISGAIGAVTGSIGSGLGRLYRLIQGILGGTVSAFMSIIQQMVTTGKIDWDIVGISAAIGVFNGATQFSGITNIVVSFVLNGVEGLFGELKEKKDSIIEVNFIPKVEMQYAY